MLRTGDFDFTLPGELIASRPLAQRDASRMMLVDRRRGTIEHRQFRDFPALLQPEDLVIFNNVRVAKARFFSNDQRIELLRLDAPNPHTWRCMVRPGKKMRQGHTVALGTATGTVAAVMEDGTRILTWDTAPDESLGHLALPHYMQRPDDDTDTERYQTVYARPDRSTAVAAPTAGLHFTPEILAAIPRRTFITLHVGPGTFQPVKADVVTDHVMHSERYEIEPAAAAAIEAAPRRIAIGTTVTRVLEHCALTHGAITPHSGETSIFIYPGFAFRRVDALLTNFHLPKSTLFMLVCALGGTELLKQAYAEAVHHRYRFYSYGDCMLII